MVSTRIKVCGITTTDDAIATTEAGVNVLGLVFYPPSPRCVTIERAIEIARCLPPFTLLVGLFVNASVQEITDVIQQVPIGLLQFHGDELEPECNRWRLPYIKAMRVRPGVPVVEMVAPYHSAQGYLLDSYRCGVPGGTGESFDWGLIPDKLDKPLILAGGLSPDNVRKAIDAVQPYAVDVSSGVELSPGVKCADKINKFVQFAGGRL